MQRICPAQQLQGRKGEEVIRRVREHTRPGSLYYTDEWRAYGSLAVRGDHIVVKKDGGRPKGWSHINGIEWFWSYAKNWLYPFFPTPVTKVCPYFPRALLQQVKDWSAMLAHRRSTICRSSLMAWRKDCIRRRCPSSLRRFRTLWSLLY